MAFSEGDWVVYDLKIGQISALRDDQIAEFTDGLFRTSGRGLADFCRPLTLRNKVIAESIDHYYQTLHRQDGSAGFNFPDIKRYFSDLALSAIDGGDETRDAAYQKAQTFVRDARD